MNNECLRCSHKWKQRGKKRPKICPSCKSKKWNEKKMDDFINLIVA